MASGEQFTSDAASSGRRALANAALDLAAANGDGDAVARVGAPLLRCGQHDRPLGGAWHPGRNGAAQNAIAALDDFHRRYQNDALVLDKWLGFEASVPAPETLDRVRAPTRPFRASRSHNPEPYPCAGRHLRRRQPDTVQSRRWRRLRIPRRPSSSRSTSATRRPRRGCWSASARGARLSRNAARLPSGRSARSRKYLICHRIRAISSRGRWPETHGVNTSFTHWTSRFASIQMTVIRSWRLPEIHLSNREERAWRGPRRHHRPSQSVCLFPATEWPEKPAFRGTRSFSLIPPYQKLLAAEPALRRLIPILIVCSW